MKNVRYTSDRVDVVRCKDCEHSLTDDYGRMCIRLDGVPVRDDFYCADGERRDDAKE